MIEVLIILVQKKEGFFYYKIHLHMFLFQKELQLNLDQNHFLFITSKCNIQCHLISFTPDFDIFHFILQIDIDLFFSFWIDLFCLMIQFEFLLEDLFIFLFLFLLVLFPLISPIPFYQKVLLIDSIPSITNLTFHKMWEVLINSWGLVSLL